MLAIYDKAAQLRPGRAVVDSTVNLAVHGLLAPARARHAHRGSRAITTRGRRHARRRRRPGARRGRRCRQEAQRILTDLLEEIHELPDALAAAIAFQQLE